jgi:hypothetical protein
VGALLLSWKSRPGQFREQAEGAALGPLGDARLRKVCNMSCWRRRRSA